MYANIYNFNEYFKVESIFFVSSGSVYPYIGTAPTARKLLSKWLGTQLIK